MAGDDVDKKKPDPTIYRIAAERLKVDPKECLVVEDSMVGLKVGPRTPQQSCSHACCQCTLLLAERVASQDSASSDRPACLHAAPMRNAGHPVCHVQNAAITLCCPCLTEPCRTAAET